MKTHTLCNLVFAKIWTMSVILCWAPERVREERVGFARHSNRGAAAVSYVMVRRRLEEPVWPVDVLGANPASPATDPTGPTGSSLQARERERESSRPDQTEAAVSWGHGPAGAAGAGRECKSCLQLDPNLAEEARPVPTIMLPFQGFFNRAEVGKFWSEILSPNVIYMNTKPTLDI